MIPVETYISANVGHVVNNCMAFYLWENRPFSDTMKAAENHVLECGYCNPEAMVNAVKSVLKNMTTAEGVTAFIREYKKNYVRPYYKTVKDFIAGEYGIPGLTAQKIAEIIIMEVN